MGHAIDEQPFPRGVLIGAAALMLFTMIAAGAARHTGVGVARAIEAPVVQERMLRFSMTPELVTAFDAASGQRIATFGTHDHGFVRVVLQGIARERMRAAVAAEAPLRLTRHSDGRAQIHDPQTGQTVLLGAFGEGNHVAFAGLFANGTATGRTAQ